jgi:hypothetical protein
VQAGSAAVRSHRLGSARVVKAFNTKRQVPSSWSAPACVRWTQPPCGGRASSSTSGSSTTALQDRLGTGYGSGLKVHS